MEIRKVDGQTAEAVAPLVADFRVTLSSYKGEEAFPDTESGKEEILGFLEKGFPVFAAWEEGVPVGYIVCRTDGPCLWVEHIFVSKEHRRKGIATMLFSKAEEIAASMGEDTVYNYVHPTNQGMIEFLRSKGYTVLNLIEIRKPYREEKLKTTIRVEDNVFDY